MKLKDLAGAHTLSGVDYIFDDHFGNRVLFCLDGITYEAVENPDDGYRSYMEELVISDKECENKFPKQDVMCEWSCENDRFFGGDDDILSINDMITKKLVLKIGTQDVTDYYPACVMEYHPENMACNRG